MNPSPTPEQTEALTEAMLTQAMQAMVGGALFVYVAAVDNPEQARVNLRKMIGDIPDVLPMPPEGPQRTQALAALTVEVRKAARDFHKGLTALLPGASYADESSYAG